MHGWVLASGSFMLCAAFNVLVARAGRARHRHRRPGRIWSARDRWRRCSGWWLPRNANPNVLALLTEPGERLGKLAVEAPEFHAAVLAELALIGHRGPAELEMLSTSYADDPELLVRMVTRALSVAHANRSRASANPVAGQALGVAGGTPAPRPRSPPRQDGARELGAARSAA